MFNLKSILLLISVTIIFSLTGCGAKGYNIKATKTQSDIIKNKTDKAYVMFGRRYNAHAEKYPVVKFLPDTKELKGIVILGVIERYILEVEPGIHYFHSFEGETDEFIKIDAKAGHIYAVDAVIGMGIWKPRFYLEPVKTKKLLDQLNSYPIIENTDAAYEWFKDNLDTAYYKKTESDFREWLEKESHKDDQHLKKNDGFKL